MGRPLNRSRDQIADSILRVPPSETCRLFPYYYLLIPQGKLENRQFESDRDLDCVTLPGLELRWNAEAWQDRCRSRGSERRDHDLRRVVRTDYGRSDSSPCDRYDRFIQFSV